MIYAQMADGEDWLMRPVFRGLMKAESLVDGTVDLEMVDLLNHAMDVEIENQRRDRANH